MRGCGRFILHFRQAPSRSYLYVAESSDSVVGNLHASIRSRSFHTPPAPLKRISTPHFQSTYRLSSRLLSTSDTQEGTSKAKQVDPPLLQTNSNGKAKAKVELRPGPVKPASKSTTIPSAGQGSPDVAIHDEVTSGTTSAKSHHVKPPPSTAHAQLSKVATADEAETGVVETAKRDMEDATRHGIFEPPPPGVGIVRRFMHQACQLFVRIRNCRHL